MAGVPTILKEGAAVVPKVGDAVLKVERLVEGKATGLVLKLVLMGGNIELPVVTCPALKLVLMVGKGELVAEVPLGVLEAGNPAVGPSGKLPLANGND